MSIRSSIRWFIPLVVTLAAAQLSAQHVATAIANDYAGNDVSTTGTAIPFTSSGTSETEFVAFPAGFQFPFFGGTYNGVWVNSCGFLNFGASGQTSDSPHSSIPDPGTPNNAFYACHTSLWVVSTQGDGVWTERLSGPDRFVIHYLTRHATTPFERVDFAVVLYPDGAIETHFGPTTTLAGSHSSLPPGMGLENDDGTIGVEAPGGFQQMPTTTTAYRYQLPQVDVDVVDVHVTEPHIGSNDVHVTVANRGSQPFTGTINLEYSVDGGIPVARSVNLTTLSTFDSHTEIFDGSDAWDIPSLQDYNLVAIINPPVIGDPDTTDEMVLSISFPQQAYYSASLVTNDFASNDVAATGAQVPLSTGGNSYSEWVDFPAGFEFPFYGDRYDGLWVSNSGFVNFGTTGFEDFNPDSTLPYSFSPNNAIYACWTRLQLDEPGHGVWTELLTGPDRFVIHYLARHSFVTSEVAELSLVLYPDGAIESHFGPNTSLTTNSHSSLPPGFGVENIDGTVGVEAPGGWRHTPSATSAFRWELPQTDLDVVDIQTDAGSGGPDDVEVVVVNNGSQPFTGSIDVEYSAGGGAPVSQTVTLSSLPTGSRHTIVFSSDLPSGYVVLEGAIRPPASGDPDAVDEYGTIVHVGAGSWTQQPASGHWSGRRYHTMTAFKGELWVMGGYSGNNEMNDIWTSSDGANWTQQPVAGHWSPRQRHAAVVFNNELWVLGGRDGSSLMNDVWSSPDGVNWTQHTVAGHWTARWHLTAVVFDSRIWVLGGRDGSSLMNDIWSSSDGVNWTQHSASGHWSPREHHSTIVFDDRIWVMGGSGSSTLNDIWSSPDGISWTQHPATKHWLARIDAFPVAVFNNRMWVLGGVTEISFTIDPSEIWSSSDGDDWLLETSTAPWSMRFGAASAVFNDRLWISGGAHAYFGNFDDVWSYIEAPLVTSSPPTTAIVDTPYAYDVIANTTGTTITASNLPAWLTFTSNTLSGTPQLSDIGLTGTITITATNSEGSYDQEFEIDVQGQPPQITSTPVEIAPAKTLYSYTVTATGVPAPTLSASGLPSWLSFDPNTGELAGTPGTGDYGTSSTVTITATNGWAPDAVQTFTINVPSVTEGSDDSDNGGCTSRTGGPALPAALIVGMLGTAFATWHRRRRNHRHQGATPSF